MNASIEWWCEHCGMLRVHPKDDGKYGDPYTYAAMFKIVAPRMVEMRGALTHANKHEWAAMETRLLDEGYDAVKRVKRYPCGRMLAKVTPLKRDRRKHNGRY